MSEKKISYLSRDFSSIRGELEKFSKQYYPELSDDWNDSSVGSWFIDLVASVGDDLSYYIDRASQETTLDSANMRSSVLEQAVHFLQTTRITETLLNQIGIMLLSYRVLVLYQLVIQIFNYQRMLISLSNSTRMGIQTGQLFQLKTQMEILLVTQYQRLRLQ